MDVVVKLVFDWPVSKILRFLVKIKALHLFLSGYIYKLNFLMTRHKNATNSKEGSVLMQAIFTKGTNNNDNMRFRLM
jgi:hypothetical protein